MVNALEIQKLVIYLFVRDLVVTPWAAVWSTVETETIITWVCRMQIIVNAETKNPPPQLLYQAETAINDALEEEANAAVDSIEWMSTQLAG